MIQRTQVAVVGAGASGIAAAYAAASSGAAVVLIDEQPAPGGWLRSSLDVLEGPPEIIAGKRGFELPGEIMGFLAAAGVDYRARSIAWGLFEDHLLGIIGPHGSYQLRADAVILASGSTDIVWPFEGWTLPGVMTARAAREFMHLHRVLPGRQVVVVGAGEPATRLVEDLELVGATVTGRCNSPDGLEAGGDDVVEWAKVANERTPADTILLALGSIPDPELARHALVEIEYSEADGCHVPTRDDLLQTSVEGLYVVGDAGGVASANQAIAEGFVSGYAAARSTELDDAREALAAVQVERPRAVTVGDPERIPDGVQVDREEQVTAGQIREAIDEGAVSINDVKRRTRAGMGASQGRDTEYVIARMIERRTGIPLSELVPMTARPPARLVSLADLAAIAGRTD